MTEITTQPPIDDSPIATPGVLLRDAREAMGLTPQQIAQRLNLRLSVVLGIEQDNYEEGMSITYIRGYIRNYARLVGLNEQEINAVLETTYQAAQQQPMQSFSERTKRERRDSRWTLMTWLIAFGVIAALIWWAVTSQMNTTNELATDTPNNQAVVSSEATSSSDQPSANMSEAVLTDNDDSAITVMESPDATVVEESASKPTDSLAAGTDSAPVAPMSESDAELVPAPTIRVPEPTASENTNALMPSLSVSVAGDCWMLIQDADGKQLVEGLKTQGYEVVVSGKAPFSVRLGAPEMVSLTYNGEPVDLSSFRAGKVARLTIPN